MNHILSDLLEKVAAFGEDEGDRSKLRQKDLELWQHWNDNGRQPEHLKPLFTQFRPAIRSSVGQYANRVDVPPVTIQAEFNKQFVKALQTYDPNKGAALNTWVKSSLRRGSRWIQTRQNIARIVEKRSGARVGEYQVAKSQLDEELGREPTHIEIAEHLGWAPKQVATLETELRKSHLSESLKVDPIDVLPSREKEVFHNLYFELSPEEQLVYDYTLGAHGKPELRPSEIARTLGFSNPKVSHIRKKITKRLEGRL